MTIEEFSLKKYEQLASGNIGKELLFRHSIALQIIGDCKKYHVIVGKIVFWQRQGNSICEVNSTDYSSIDTGEYASRDTTLAAQNLIKKKFPDDAEYISLFLYQKK